MGKASSSKKVARAARAGGKQTGKKKQLGFPLAIGLVVVLGLSLLVYARSSGQLGEDATNSPKVGEHWHASYGIYICDHFVTSVGDRGPDTLGIHTHEDGLIHIHPFSVGAAGKQATMARFFDQTGMSVNDSTIKLPAAAPFKGRTYTEGKTTCNGKPAEVKIEHWKQALDAAAGAKATKTFTTGLSKVRFTEDMGAYTIAFVPKGAKVPPPPGAGDILKNAQNDQSPSAETGDTTEPVLTVTGDTETTVAGQTPSTAPTATTVVTDTTATPASDSP